MIVDEPRLAAVARALGARLEVGDVLLLTGPMGAGKTTLTRALAEGLGVHRPERVRSPTYNICLTHPGRVPLCHVDLFRLAADADDGAPAQASVSDAAFEALGLPALGVSASTEGVLVVEWADLWAEPPPVHVRIRLDFAADGLRRTLQADPQGARPQAVVAAWEQEISVP